MVPASDTRVGQRENDPADRETFLEAARRIDVGEHGGWLVTP
jgi:hypothetical protein